MFYTLKPGWWHRNSTGPIKRWKSAKEVGFAKRRAALTKNKGKSWRKWGDAADPSLCWDSQLALRPAGTKHQKLGLEPYVTHTDRRWAQLVPSARKRCHGWQDGTSCSPGLQPASPQLTWIPPTQKITSGVCPAHKAAPCAFLSRDVPSHQLDYFCCFSPANRKAW